MIRLTLNPKSDPEIHLFNKSSILLGTDHAHADLILNNQELSLVHLKIIEQSGVYYAINEANDPFVLVNGQPFKKKPLKSPCLITIRETEILFEETAPAAIENPIIEEKNPVPPPSEKTEPTPSLLNIDLPFEKEIEALKEDDWKGVNFERMISESEKGPIGINRNERIVKRKKEEEGKSSKSLKDDYLKDLEDDQPGQTNAFTRANDSGHLYQAWKWIFLFIISALSIAGIAGTVIFYSLSDKIEEQELKAAQGVADIAMALTQARMHHLKPHNQNWSDVDFLKSNLESILPNSTSYASQVDGQGQFHCCPFTLRTYTNGDLSRFLLIAQPTPGFFHRIIPKPIILLDSESMELRTLKDIRGINRLLANTNPLEGVNGKEIFSLIKEGKLIRLSSLANESGHQDYAPPKNLAWVKPGAENAIYNAPRYYRLGRDLLHKAESLSTTKTSSQEVAAFKSEVAHFSKLANLILYSDSKKDSILARQNLMLFAPSDNFLFGYIQFDPSGGIHQIHLLKEEDFQDVVLGPKMDSKGELLAYTNMNEEKLPHLSIDTIDTNHPIYIQLNALNTRRENELRPLSAALYQLVNEELDSPKRLFQTEFQNLFHTYMIANSRHKHGIKETISHLYQQYEDMPLEEFMGYISHFRFNDLVSQKDDCLTIKDEHCISNLENIYTHISTSKSLLELDNLIHIATLWLNFEHLKNPQELIQQQNFLRNHVLKQMTVFLLTKNNDMSFHAEDRETLEHILNNERLIKSDERDYFLSEFDRILIEENKVATPEHAE